MRRHERSPDPRVREILARHARLRNGVPTRCAPTKYERMMRERYGNSIETQNKIIYDTEEAAQAAAIEFAALNDSPRLEVYPCKRSTRGHCHLKTPYQH